MLVQLGGATLLRGSNNLTNMFENQAFIFIFSTIVLSFDVLILGDIDQYS